LFKGKIDNKEYFCCVSNINSIIVCLEDKTIVLNDEARKREIFNILYKKFTQQSGNVDNDSNFVQEDSKEKP
jgi:hypothetical protein